MAREKPAENGASAVMDIPLRFGADPYVWACWLYYEEGLTQGDIASTMGISRATVNAYLADARERGIIQITLDPARLASLHLAQELKRHFGLHDCIVAPTRDDGEALIDRLGAVGAQVLEKLIRSGDRLAVVWGRTTLAVGERLKLTGLQDVTVLQATGGTAATLNSTPQQCAWTFAEAVGGHCENILAPIVVSSPAVRQMLEDETMLRTQLQRLTTANKIIFSIASLRPNSTVHQSGLLDEPGTLQHYLANKAVGTLTGHFIDERGRRVAGPLDDRVIGMGFEQMKAIPTRIGIAGGTDKVPAILAALRGQLISVLVTDAVTARGILRADGVGDIDAKLSPRPRAEAQAFTQREQVKKFINDPQDVIEEMMAGAIAAYRSHMTPLPGYPRALVAKDGPRDGKVGIVIGGGSGHEPCFFGYVGKGLADAVAVGNVFSSPPPDPIFECVKAVDRGAGVLFVYGNYHGDVMNFDMAAEIATEAGIPVRTVITTDDIASANREDREGRRGVAGNVFAFKIAGAAADRGLDLETCATITRRCNERTFTLGVALEPCSLPQTRRYNFEIGPDDMEIGIGIHGEPGVLREALTSADEIVDMVMDKIFAEMRPGAGDRVAVLVNSFGSTPMMELFILYRRIEERLSAKSVTIAANWIGHYCTSIDMAGASISVLHLDAELEDLLAHPCDGPALRVG
ncbi:dihydroxyacetone kinase, N-terminal domain [Rhizobium sp. RU20A]|uniref:bifunctional sugar-binding transcriptional regulator/dihydroxyacetone kinase subunit DhaK n=1 Tax=Rhizobium sp. RU20A TaxID=1907412 RepID=UPI000955B3F8|nr:bifunctional sugar-binding transcriptional regulator/dihydroxyacetone kinase subunit DhaK [Rhizobium sp. RU20A]SIR32571.1 dihydroxyacetone kinase, N-terminal domain [Rhizobium sp. RU20A]